MGKKLSFTVLRRTLSYALFPRRCALCFRAVPADVEICGECAAGLRRVEAPRCPLCGRGKKECLCCGRRIFYEAAAAPFYYSGAVKRSIIGLKSGSSVQNADALSQYMADCVRECLADKSFDFVTCVPLSKQAMKKRGFNQSALLARGLAKRLELSFEEKLLVRTFQKQEQKNLSASRRRGGVFAAFECRECEKVKNKTVLLCDDIATTGATLNECAKMLLLAGADEVCCVTAAVTSREVRQCSEQT